jgi:hypothetical protein
MPGGGYVTSYIDITEEASVRQLKRTLAGLETRVAERTRELSEANALLARADRDKTRFLAAASHDLLQPLHAARLFSAALAREVPERSQSLVSRVDSAILAAEDLLRALLDISRSTRAACEGRPNRCCWGRFWLIWPKASARWPRQRGCNCGWARWATAASRAAWCIPTPACCDPVAELHRQRVALHAGRRGAGGGALAPRRPRAFRAR